MARPGPASTRSSIIKRAHVAGIHLSLAASALALCALVVGLLIYTARAAARLPTTTVAPLRPT